MSDPVDFTEKGATDHLILRTPQSSDLPALFALYSDPQVWGPDPLTRHDSIEQTNQMIRSWRAAWDRDGLGMWTAWLPGSQGPFVGIGGAFIRYGVAWNLGFRLLPRFWGRGYAQEISRAALVAARGLRPDLPMTAYLLDGNDRSRRAVERTGLTLLWRGPDHGNPDRSALRLLYGDRRLPRETLSTLTDN